MFIESDMFFSICVVKISMCEENYIITQQNSNMLKWKDFTIPGDDDIATLNIDEINSELVIPVLISSGTGNWDISTSFQSSNKLIILCGSGMSQGYNYVVRAFYFNQPW